MQVSTPWPQTRGVSRRQCIAAGGTLIAGSGVLAVLGSRRVRASVDFSVPDETYEGEDGSVDDLRLTTDGAYQWQAPSADAVALTLSVAPPDTTDWVEIDAIERSASGTSGNGQFGLSGSVLAHPTWDASEFSADAGEATAQDVAARVGFEVLDAGDRVAADHATDTATVTVTNTSVATTVSVSADGEIEILV